MAEVVGRELRFETARVAREGHRHDPGVVQEHVHRMTAEEGARRERVDRRGVGEVERIDLHVGDPGEHRLCLCQRARADADVRAGARACPRGLEPDACRPAGDDEVQTVEPPIAEHIACGGSRSETRSERYLRCHGSSDVSYMVEDEHGQQHDEIGERPDELGARPALGGSRP